MLNSLPKVPVTYLLNLIANLSHHSVHSNTCNRFSIIGGCFLPGSSSSKVISFSEYVFCIALSRIASSSGVTHQISTEISPTRFII
ncbi:MAG: hypothetical protein ACOZBL_03845 [Patescibacteria group bacterium]